MAQPIHILHLEDDANDAALLSRALSRAGLDVRATVCGSRAELERGLTDPTIALIVSDNGVFDVSARGALEMARERRPEIPFVFFVGIVEENDALGHLAAGALDCVSKDQVWRLVAHARAVVARGAIPVSPSATAADAETARTLDVGEAIAALRDATDVQSVIEVVRAAGKRLVAADEATIVLRDGDDILFCDERSAGPIQKGFRAPLAGSITGTAILTGRPFVVSDLAAAPDASKSMAGRVAAVGIAAYPIGKPPFAVMVVSWKQRYTPSQRETTLLTTLADAVALVLGALLSRQALEKQMRDRSLALEAANRELEAFSYSVSHDLRAPLRHISGYTEALVEDAGDRLPEEVRGHVGQVRKAVKRMDSLIADLLSLARVASTEMRIRNVDLSALASRVGQRLHEDAPQRDVELVVEQGLVVRGDEGLLRIAMENLLGNAWKYTSRNEHAHVHVGRAATPDVGGASNGTTVFVRDDGAGFDPSLASRLFRPFQRLHAPDEFAGTGIGLATVQRIVNKHGGRIWAEGKLGEGATFYLTLPSG